MLAILLATLLLVYCLIRLYSLFPRSKKNGVRGQPQKLSPKEKFEREVFEFAGEEEEAELSGKPVRRLLILYGSEYGFAKEVSRRTAATLAGRALEDAELEDAELADRVAGLRVELQPRVLSVAHYRLADLAREAALLVVCSTTGDGVPPTDAAKFLAALASGELKLPPALRWATLALGDRGYPHFCRGGIQVDDEIRRNTAADPALPVQTVDQEDWEEIGSWWNNVVDYLETTDLPETPGPDPLRERVEAYELEEESADGKVYSRDSPFYAKVASKTQLTVHGLEDLPASEEKEVIRVEFDIEGSGLNYNPGDAVGIVPINDDSDVEKILVALGAVGDEQVEVASEMTSLRNALRSKLDLKVVRGDLIAAFARACGDKVSIEKARELLGANPLNMNASAGKTLVEDWELIDVLTEFSGSASMNSLPALNEITKLLKPLHARYYSVSSTPLANGDRLAITVDVLRYWSRGLGRKGVASTFLKDRCALEDPVGIFLARNEKFRLPPDPSTPIIMVGPGTGIAPFIAFLEERQLTRATGRNLLFFGCRRRKQDFLYKKQLETLEHDAAVELYRAFSREGPRKVYVQHRMLEVREELWRLIDGEKAHVYVCGDARRMARDVHETLLSVVGHFGEAGGVRAEEYMKELEMTNRYQRDVWVS